MSAAVVQSITPTTANGVTLLQSNAFGIAVTTGNTVLVAVGFYGPPTPTVTDTAGNTYTLDATATGLADTARRLYLFRSSNVTGGSSFKVTSTGITGGNYFAIGAVEVSGLTNVTPADGSGVTNVSDGSTSPSTGNWSTTNADDILISVCAVIDLAGTTFSATPSGFTSWGNVDGGAQIGLNCQYKIVSAAQTNINQSWTLSTSDDWLTIGYAYKSLGVGGGGGPSFEPKMSSAMMTFFV